MPGSTASSSATAALERPPLRPADGDPPLLVSLAQWSLREDFWNGRVDPVAFPTHSAEAYGIHGIEFVNSFFRDRIGDEAFLDEMQRRADDAGVRMLLIMCDGLGRLGDPDAAARRAAVEAHRPWLEVARRWGCHCIRVNAGSSGSREEQARLAADGLRSLCEIGETMQMNVVVENHGGWSSDGSWLADVMRRVGHPRIGTLPDFGNFALGGGRTYDRYLGTAELMPWARAVSAKSHDFDDTTGDETDKDYRRLLDIVIASGYRGWVGIEYEGTRLPAPEGVRRTKQLMERILAERAAESRS